MSGKIGWTCRSPVCVGPPVPHLLSHLQWRLEHKHSTTLLACGSVTLKLAQLLKSNKSRDGTEWKSLKSVFKTAFFFFLLKAVLEKALPPKSAFDKKKASLKPSPFVVSPQLFAKSLYFSGGGGKRWKLIAPLHLRSRTPLWRLR